MEQHAELCEVRHKFRQHQIDLNAKILIIGTFNPDIGEDENNADFFYSRQVRAQNQFWKLLPRALGYNDIDLTGVGRRAEKEEFARANGIDFVDLVDTLVVPLKQRNNVDDAFIDRHIVKFRDVVGDMKKLDLVGACVTRSSFAGIPRMRHKIVELAAYCREHKIEFAMLISPSPATRKSEASKIEEWKAFFDKCQHRLKAMV